MVSDEGARLRSREQQRWAGSTTGFTGRDGGRATRSPGRRATGLRGGCDVRDHSHAGRDRRGRRPQDQPGRDPLYPVDLFMRGVSRVARDEEGSVMAGRIRSIKPEILEDEKPAGFSSDAWRLWVSMWLVADDHGRLRGAPAWLKGQVFWHKRHESVDVALLIEELAKARVITRYRVADQPYIEVRNWTKHQKVDHPGKPRVPAPEEGVIDDIRESLAKHSETLAPDLRSPTTTTTTTNDHEPPPASPEEFDFGIDKSSAFSAEQHQRIVGSKCDPGAAPEGLKCDPRNAAKPRGLKFDFEAIYALYPRKLGRKRGLKLCESRIKSAELYSALERSVMNYARTVEAERTEQQFIKHFDTFMGCWEDWIDPPPTPRATPTRGGRAPLPLSSAVNPESRAARKW